MKYEKVHKAAICVYISPEEIILTIVKRSVEMYIMVSDKFKEGFAKPVYYPISALLIGKNPYILAISCGFNLTLAFTLNKIPCFAKPF